MKCPHCKQELGSGDSYDLMKAHLWSCNSEAAQKYARAIEEETQGHIWDYEA